MLTANLCIVARKRRVFMQPSASAALNQSSRLHTFVCVVLAICSWRGPVPVLHHHDQYSADLRQQHLAIFHETSAESAGVCDEWHWHLALPGDADPTQDCSSKNVPADVYTLAFCVALDGNSQSMAFESLVFQWMNCQTVSGISPEPVRDQASLLADQQQAIFTDRLCLHDLSSLTGVALI